MQMSLSLFGKRRFLPLFVTQFLGAMNDNLFKNTMVLFVIYKLMNDPRQEETFSAIATTISILPFFLLSALAGQIADAHDKAWLIRLVKTFEIAIMLVGGLGLLIGNIVLMMIALFALGIHSTFFGPIKYAILPQHLHVDEVLGGTGLIEAGTYIAILLGTILAGFMNAEVAALIVLGIALIGWATARYVPPAPPVGTPDPIDWNIARASYTLVSATMHIRKLFLAILSISFFWMISAILFVQFPPLVKNILTGDKSVASLFLAIFSVGIAIGSVAINRLLNGKVSARYAPASVIMMGVFIVGFHLIARNWAVDMSGHLATFMEFVRHDGAIPLIGCLLGIATAGGMFIVPLYAFLTTSVPPSETARTVGANNFVNSGCTVVGSVAAIGLSKLGVPSVDQFLVTAVLCLACAALAWKLHKATD